MLTLYEGPHCNVGIHEGLEDAVMFQESQITSAGQVVATGGFWFREQQRCPECYEGIIFLRQVIPGPGTKQRFMAYPRAASHPIPSEVTEPYRQDFSEACIVLPLSPKASAALSRRCLQAVLKDKAGAKSKDLADEIDEVINAKVVPGYIADNLHAVRNIGNFAAHPIKSKNTGEIVEVEPGEAEWNLDVLESLFEFYFVQPAQSAKRKAELNKN